MPRPKQQMTLVQALIMVAVLGILAAVGMPSMQRAKQRAMQVRTDEPVASQQVQEPAGQLNTIEVSEVSSEEKEPGAEMSGRSIGPLIRLAITAVVVVAIINAFRRRMKSAQQ